jgi:hypothetical protein
VRDDFDGVDDRGRRGHLDGRVDDDRNDGHGLRP